MTCNTEKAENPVPAGEDGRRKQAVCAAEITHEIIPEGRVRGGSGSVCIKKELSCPDLPSPHPGQKGEFLPTMKQEMIYLLEKLSERKLRFRLPRIPEDEGEKRCRKQRN